MRELLLKEFDPYFCILLISWSYYLFKLQRRLRASSFPGDGSYNDEAMLRDDKLKWEKVMQSKMDSLHHSSTWELVSLPIGKTTLP